MAITHKKTFQSKSKFEKPKSKTISKKNIKNKKQIKSKTLNPENDVENDAEFENVYKEFEKSIFKDKEDILKGAADDSDDGSDFEDVNENESDNEDFDKSLMEDEDKLKYEIEDEEQKLKINLKRIKKWEEKLKNVEQWENIQGYLMDAMSAFARASIVFKDKDTKDENQEDNIPDPEEFNAIVRLCCVQVPRVIRQMFKTTKTLKAKKWWPKFNRKFKEYLLNLTLLISHLSNASASVMVFNHGLLPLLPLLDNLVMDDKVLVISKQLVRLWASCHKKIRVVCLVALVRLVKIMKKDYVERLYKLMYFAYVTNSRVTSEQTDEHISYMRMSLAELYCMNPQFAYRHAFLYLRQLAVHLRNAIKHKTNETLSLVTHWQFVHSLRLWAEVACLAHPGQVLAPIMYPIVQICLGLRELSFSVRLYPLCLVVTSLLIEISNRTGVFIPILTTFFTLFKINILKRREVYKKKNVNTDWSYKLKATPEEVETLAYSQFLLRGILDLLLEVCELYRSNISFPELMRPLVKAISTYERSKPETRLQDELSLLKKVRQQITNQLQKVDEARKAGAIDITNMDTLKKWEIEFSQTQSPFVNLKKSEQTKRQALKTPNQGPPESWAPQNEGLGDIEHPLSIQNVRMRMDSWNDNRKFTKPEITKEPEKKKLKKNKKSEDKKVSNINEDSENEETTDKEWINKIWNKMDENKSKMELFECSDSEEELEERKGIFDKDEEEIFDKDNEEEESD